MKNTRLTLIFILMLLCVGLAFSLTACGDDEHIHTPNSAVREKEVSSTCTAVGSYDEVIYCSECNEEISRTTKTTEMLSHTPSDWITDTEATCKVEGEKHKECTVCHTELGTSKIDKLITHTPADAVRENEVNSKCDAAGSYDEVVYCSVCNIELSREEKEIAKLPHTEATDIAKAPTCTETGLTEGKHCSVCNEVLIAQETVKANGHADDNNDYTCDICKADLCTEHKEEIIPAVSATCTESGLTEGKKCSVCGDILVAQETVKANGHRYIVENTDSKYLDKAADCENAATYFYSCACGEKGATAFAYGEPNGHSYTVQNTASKYFATAADCENAATYFYSCACGDKGTTTFTHGEPNGHSFVVEKADIDYQHTPATEYSAAIYYKSCSCGKASTIETFTYGDMLPGYLTYKLSEDSSYYIVTGYVGAQTEISVPHLYDGLPVFVIMEGAFRDNTYIQSITLPNSIQVIGSYAFANCTSLESIIIPTSVTYISPYTFSGCTALETITLHSGIEVLGTYAFEKCSALKSITLNEGLKTISDNAFDYCTALESILIPDTVTTLGNMAFRHAESLGTVKFSKALKSIGNSTFQYCVKLESVELHENIDILGNSTFSYCDGLKSIRILGNLTTIGKATFYECRSLESIYYASSAPGNCGDSNYIFYNAGINGEGIVLTIAKDAVIPEGFFTPYVAENLPKITKIIIENGSINVNFALQYNNLPHLTEVVYPDTVTDPCYGAFNNSLWWDNQNFGEVFINGIFYGYKCHCYIATPEEPVTENYVDSQCTVDGGYDTVIYCKICKDELKRIATVIPQVGHSPKTATEENRIEATCTEDGHYDSVVYCNRCNSEVSRTGKTITKLGHSPKTAVEENRIEATCTEDGHYDTVVYCNRCDGEVSRTTETITKLGHSPKSAVEENRVEATCTEDGHYDSVIYCNRCNDELKRTNTVIQKGHSPKSAVEENRIEATCIKDGHYDAVIYCSVCNDELSRVVKTILRAHKMSNGECSVCGLPQSSSGLKFSLNSDGKSYTVTGIGTCTSKNIVLGVYNNLSVTSIGNSAFNNCRSLTSVTIPDSVTSIGNSAFSNCDSLTSITVDENNTIYKSIDGNLYTKDGTTLIQYAVGKTDTSFTIPKGVTTIGSSTFEDCDSLTSVTIPDSVTSIGDAAFGRCTSITSVTIGDSVTSIGTSAFYGCTSLVNITIGDSVESIGNSAFAGCTALEEIYFNATAMNDLSYNNSLFSNAGKNGDGIKVVIGKNVTKLPAYLFYYYIDKFYKSDTPEITSVEFEEGSICESIGEFAFERCTSITSVTIGDSVTSIGTYAFYNCTSLTSVTIGNSVTSIGSRAFSDCTALEEIYFNATVMSDLSSDNNVFTDAGKNGDGIKVVIGKNVTKLPAYLFYPRSDTLSYSPKITRVEFEDGSVCESIGKYTFYGCESLTSIEISDSVTSIGGRAFSGCTILEEIYFNATAMSDLGSNNYVFYNAGKDGDGIKVVIGKNVTKLPAYLFYPRSDISSYSPKITIVEFEEGSICESIGEFAFERCTSLKRIEIPSSITSIGSSAFASCSSLTSVYISDIAAWCNIEFNDSWSNPLYWANNLYLNGELVTDLVIPESVKSIGTSAFYGCTSLTSVTIGNSVKSIGRSAFSFCTALEEIYFNATAMKNLSYDNNVFYNAGKNGDGIKVVIGKSVTKLPAYLFCPDYTSSSPKITSVEFEEESVCESIGECAFMYCVSLTRVTIPDSATSIGAWAFCDCSSLTSIEIPNSVTSIGTSTFDGCTSLTSVTFENPSGWSAGDTSIRPEELQDKATAAKYLTNTYYSKKWTKE